jgi:nitrite reductase (NADH) small subunit
VSWESFEFGGFVEDWVRVCEVGEAPEQGDVKEVSAQGVEICLANVDGTLCALNNRCPHREGPLGQGWVEGRTVVCPWHSWAFDCETGVAQAPDKGKVAVYPVKVEGDAVLVKIECRA